MFYKDWSLEAVFERQLLNACPLATQSRVLVDLKNAGKEYELKPFTKQENDIAIYHLPKGQCKFL
jgi:phosphatidylinositol glycan class T